MELQIVNICKFPKLDLNMQRRVSTCLISRADTIFKRKSIARFRTEFREYLMNRAYLIGKGRIYSSLVLNISHWYGKDV